MDRKEQMHQYYLLNKDRIREYNRNWKKNNPEKVKLQAERYYNKNIDSIKKKALKNSYKYKEYHKKYIREWYRKDKENILARAYKSTKIWRAKNKERVANNRNSWFNENYKNNLKFYIKTRLRASLKKALRNYGLGKNMPSNNYGINFIQIIDYLKPFPEDIKKYHIDHIKPLSSFDLTNPEEIKKAFAPENHQWLLAEINLKKSNKLNYIKNEL